MTATATCTFCGADWPPKPDVPHRAWCPEPVLHPKDRYRYSGAILAEQRNTGSERHVVVAGYTPAGGAIVGELRFLDPDGDYPATTSSAYSWGYGGSGPTALARAILSHVLGGEVPRPVLCQAFKATFIATIPQDDNWTIESDAIVAWLAEWVTRERREHSADGNAERETCFILTNKGLDLWWDDAIEAELGSQ